MFCNTCGNKINEGTKFCTKCGTGAKMIGETRVFKQLLTQKRIFIGSGIIFLIVIFWISSYYINNNKEQKVADDSTTKAEQTQKDIASSVVNIYCEGSNGWNDDDQVSGGSGTIITTDGLVLTNAHIIPQGGDESVNKKSCLVILPDPTTGASKEIYYAKPIVIPDISKEYDLAFVQIDDVYYDSEEGKAYGEYPKVFPAYDGDKYCKNEDVKLGESIRIYGYPAISGGYALTITDGIVSSLLLKSGYIITSAKISHGNSGGLAVDQNGCRIGVPSMVTGDDYESLGVIISNNLITEFTDEVRTLLKEKN